MPFIWNEFIIGTVTLLNSQNPESYMLNGGRIAALAGLALCCACSDSTVGPTYEHPGGLPNDPPEFVLGEFDGYAGDQEAKLYWDASRFSESGPITAGLEEVKLWMSLIGPLEGFSLLRDGFSPGLDSTLVSDLTNGISYFFRITAHDSLGGVVAGSEPIWLEPGPQVVPVISISAPQEGPFGDLRYRRNLAWSPDGTFLAFIKITDEDAENVCILKSDDLSLSQLSHFNAGRTSTPAWSPSQEKLAFTNRDPYPRWPYRIWTGSLANGELKSVSTGEVDFDPCWLSDDEILFCKGTYGPPNIPELAVVRLSDGSEQKLTFDQKIYKSGPARSPSASVVVYTGRLSGDRTGSLWLFDLGTRASHRLTENRYWEEVTPSWSSDGSHVLFGSDRSGHFEIWSLNLLTGEESQVSRASSRGFEHFNGALSPDGSRLAHFRSSPTEVWLEISVAQQ